MKKITIVGTGLGPDTMTPEAQDAIAHAEVLIGAERMLALCGDSLKPCYPVYLPEDVSSVIAKNDAQTYAVLVSGDVGFYSAAAALSQALATYEVDLVAGVSSVSAFFARLKLPWQDAAFVSAHGKEANIADTVRRNRLTFCLTGNNVAAIGRAMTRAGLGGVAVYVGENLGGMGERISCVVAKDLPDASSLTVLLFTNDDFDDRSPLGLPDGDFKRLPKIPMTKSETRAVILSKLRIRPDSICWDVGAGSGSVTVEMALSAYRGHVYAIERREDAIPLIEGNCAAFHVGNVTPVWGQAPLVLESLPAPDVVFIGGSGGTLPEILVACLLKNPSVRMVVSAVTIETVQTALTAFEVAGLEPEIIQINVARGKKVGNLHMMEAQNPVTILSVGGQS